MSNQDDGLAQMTAGVVQLVFSLLFPILLVTLCGVSYVLVFGFHLVQFGLWAYLAMQAVAYAKGNTWAALALTVFVIASVPLAKVAFREHATRTSGVIGGWVGAGIFSGGTIWLATAWPAEDSGMQMIVFAFLLLASWGCVCEAIMSSLKLIAQNRPQPGPEIVEAQKAHGDAQLAGEAEALSLLNSKK